MARRVTDKDIKEINEAYLICRSISGTAAATGWSTSTVRKYIIDGYEGGGRKSGPTAVIEPGELDGAMDYVLNHSNLSCLTEQEKADMKNIWKGMLV